MVFILSNYTTSIEIVQDLFLQQLIVLVALVGNLLDTLYMITLLVRRLFVLAVSKKAKNMHAFSVEVSALKLVLLLIGHKS